MWDPGVPFAEVRRARVAGWARAFILVDETGGRGTPEAPGLMAALDAGERCDGLAFRLPEATVAAEFPRIWNREMIGPGYRPLRLPAQTDHGTIEAVTFAAEHGAPGIRPDLCLADQATMVATGAGILGTSLDYLENLARHFAELRIEDEVVTRLLAAARAQAGTR
jgi:cation transport protein ChaC